MITHYSTLYGTKIIADLIWDVAYFPVWWYSRGLIKTMVFINDFIVSRERSLAFMVWMKNIFVPMYGQYDWQGRLISFFIRLFQIVIRGLAMIFWLLFAVFIFTAYLIFPVLVFYEIYFQVS